MAIRLLPAFVGAVAVLACSHTSSAQDLIAIMEGRFLTQREAGGRNETGDLFGFSLATGDFNNDSYKDLAVGGPGKAPNQDPKSGAIVIFPGSSFGLSRGVFLTQRDTPGMNEAGDRFGHSLAAGDFDNDGFDDLVVGAPGESPGRDPRSGAIIIFRGSASGLTKGSFLTQRKSNGANEAGDRFGHSLAAGDFDNDGFDDLVVGTPGESPGPDPKSGAIVVFPGSSTGLTRGTFLTQTAVVDGSNDVDDKFGWSLAVGDFNNDGFDDLGVGAYSKAPGSPFDPEPRSGAVFVFPGSVAGLSAATIRSQDRAGGSNEAGDVFGYSLAAGDFNNDDLDDLAVGAPGEAPSSDPKAGVIFFFMGSKDAAPSNQLKQDQNYQLALLSIIENRPIRRILGRFGKFWRAAPQRRRRCARW